MKASGGLFQLCGPFRAALSRQRRRRRRGGSRPGSSSSEVYIEQDASKS